MENFGWKGLGITLYQRVILSYRTTLIGIALAGGDALLAYFGGINLPVWAHTLVGIAATLFALVKTRTQVVPATGFSRPAVLLVLSLMLGGCALFTRTTTVLIPAEVKACGDQAIEVYQQVSAALELPTYEAKLLAIAVALPNGYQLVKCAVQTYIAWNTPAPSAVTAHLATIPDPNSPVARARAYLAAHQ